MAERGARIALDAMGGDLAPAATVAGALEAERSERIKALLVGDAEQIREQLRAAKADPEDWQIEHAPDVIGMDEHPVAALRGRKTTSIRRAADLLKAGDVDGVVTMGNTGAATAAGVLVVGRAAGASRPALAGLLPSVNSPVLVLDVGANAEAKPRHLLEFAVMGAAYHQHILGTSHPTVGILSIGEERAKGNALVLEAAELLTEAPSLRFSGHIEPKDIMRGAAHVVVCDGFTGNVLIKTMEATGEYVLSEFRHAVRRRRLAKLGALLMLPALRDLRRRMDYAEYGGVPMLGINGTIIIGHGRSNARAVTNALRVAERAVRERLVGTIEEGLAGLG